MYILLSPDSYENIVKDHGRDDGKCWVEDVLYDPLNNEWTVSYNGRCIQFLLSEALTFESPKQIWEYIAIEEYSLSKDLFDAIGIHYCEY